MNKLLSIDLEFNKNKNILSAGLLEIKNETLASVKELFFENFVDCHTFKIHGLTEEFLKENSSKKETEEDIKNLVKEQDYIIGFDLTNDFKALKLNGSQFYGKRKVIDIKYILSFFGMEISLENASKKMKIFPKCKGMFPLHTSIMDSFVSYLIFEYLVIFVLEETKFNRKEVYEDLAAISSCAYFSEKWNYDYYYEKYYFLYRELKTLRDVEIIEKKSTKRIEIPLKDHIEIYDENFNIVGKTKNLKNIQANKFFKPEFALGYKS